MITLNTSTLLNGGGIDVTSVVNQILSQDGGQQQVLLQQESALQTQAGLLTSINNDLGSLATAVNALSDVLGPLSAMKAESSQSTILTASAQSSARAGTHTVIVSTLATQGTLYTNALADAGTSILPSGAQSADLQFQLGGANGATHDIPLTSGLNDTVGSLAQYINKQNWGVTASVLSDATGARLAIFSNSSGSAGALAITKNTSNMMFNPPVGGTDAAFTVDGIPFSSTSNTVADAIPGVTLNLLGAYSGVQVQVAVAPDTTQAVQAVADFVTAYNTVMGDINQQFKVDPTTNNEGPLGSAASLRMLQSSLLANATYASGSGTYATLSSLGITMNDDGTLTVDSSQLNNAISNDLPSVLSFFQNIAQTGFANSFSKDLRNLTDSTLGPLSSELTQNRSEQQNITNSLQDLQDRLSAEQKSLQSQFSQVNALLQAFPYQLRAIQTLLGMSPSSIGGSSGSSNSSG